MTLLISIKALPCAQAAADKWLGESSNQTAWLSITIGVAAVIPSSVPGFTGADGSGARDWRGQRLHGPLFTRSLLWWRRWYIPWVRNDPNIAPRANVTPVLRALLLMVVVFLQVETDIEYRQAWNGGLRNARESIMDLVLIGVCGRCKGGVGSFITRTWFFFFL